MTLPATQTAQKPNYNQAQQKLIKAALNALMEEGVKGCSVRKICQRADMAVGLINYHFGTLNDLLAAAYLELAFSLMDEAINQSQDIPLPRQRLSVFIQTTFSDSVLQRKILRAWIVFWSLIDSAPQIKQAHDTSNQAFRVYLEQSFTELNQQYNVKPSAHLAAIGLTAIIDGLWLEWCLSTDTFSAEQAILLSEQWVDGACQSIS
jgi:AcrR family transcriptional regulator